MQKLHLVGVTTDHEGLILSARRGARSGGYVLAIDGALEEAVDALRARRAEEDAAQESADEAGRARSQRVESALPVREIQARLRQGRSIAEVAKAAGVEPEWVDRFAAPVLAERAQVVAKVRTVPLRRPRLGPSAQPIGDAVRHHLADRGVALTADEFADAWTAQQVAEGRWAVRFVYRYRGRDHTLRFDLDEASGEVTAADRVSGQLGYVAPDAARPAGAGRPRPGGPPARPTIKRATVSTGFRPERAPAKAVSRSAKERERAAVAMRRAAEKRAVEAERAAARRVRERAAEAARRAREEQAAAARAAREQRQREQAALAAERAKQAAAKQAAAAKKAAAKRAAAKKAPAKQVAPAKKAAAKRAAARKAPAKQVAPVQKAPAKQVAPVQKAPAKQVAPAKKAAAKQVAPVQKAPAKKAPVKQAPPRTKAAEKAAPVTKKAVPVQKATAPAVPRPEVPKVVVAAAPAAPSAPATPAEPARPRFRPGLVEQVAADRARIGRRLGEPPAPSPNGADDVPPPRPRPDRPRRTRPLRAT